MAEDLGAELGAVAKGIAGHFGGGLGEVVDEGDEEGWRAEEVPEELFGGEAEESQELDDGVEGCHFGEIVVGGMWIGLDVRLMLELMLADLGNSRHILRRKYTESLFAE